VSEGRRGGRGLYKGSSGCAVTIRWVVTVYFFVKIKHVLRKAHLFDLTHRPRAVN
jgi:hypothetical protein